MPRHAIDVLGKTFGRLSVLRRVENSAAGAARWRVRCTCGTEKVIRGTSLYKGLTVSCGCYGKERTVERKTTHGKTNTFEFNVWQAMRKRCTNPNHVRYARYGGRGIRICERWSLFENFLQDMGVCPFPNGSIERVDNDGNYTPENCVWLPKNQQAKNRNIQRKINGNQIT